MRTAANAPARPHTVVPALVAPEPGDGDGAPTGLGLRDPHTGFEVAVWPYTGTAAVLWELPGTAPVLATRDGGGPGASWSDDAGEPCSPPPPAVLVALSRLESDPRCAPLTRTNEAARWQAEADQADDPVARRSARCHAAAWECEDPLVRTCALALAPHWPGGPQAMLDTAADVAAAITT